MKFLIFLAVSTFICMTIFTAIQAEDYWKGGWGSSAEKKFKILAEQGWVLENCIPPAGHWMATCFYRNGDYLIACNPRGTCSRPAS